ncbi:hypothetical protein AB0M22_03200 [Nocardia sp. NPDC051756]|uniref:hypothetical protein n=1 Tax=Nocardia sp. NPDC051756 TaxID=3154751 RepID=UPI003447E6F3
MKLARTRLVFDAMCLNHFAQIDRLDVLRDLLVQYECSTTEFVRKELRAGMADHPLLVNALESDWLGVVPLDSIEELILFDQWANRIGAGQRDVGEASIFAAAEILNGIAITDDKDATRVARKFGLEVHGTLWLLANACKLGKLSEGAAGNLIDMLIDSEMRLPCIGFEFPAWARSHGLL